jgi:hypothetical protein
MIERRKKKKDKTRLFFTDNVTNMAHVYGKFGWSNHQFNTILTSDAQWVACMVFLVRNTIDAITKPFRLLWGIGQYWIMRERYE